MKKVLIMVMAIATITFYQNCSGRHELFEESDSLSSSTGYEDVNMALSEAAFERTVYPIISQAGMCADCHGVDQQPLHSVPDISFAHDVWISFGLVDLRNPANSLAVQRMDSGDAHINNRGIPAATQQQLQDAIQAWSDELVANGGLLGVGTGTQPTFSSIFTDILEPRCISCHSAGNSAENIDYSDYVNTINTGLVVIGNAGASRLYTETFNGNEPRGTAGELTAQEKQAIADWINRGALNN